MFSVYDQLLNNFEEVKMFLNDSNFFVNLIKNEYKLKTVPVSVTLDTLNWQTGTLNFQEYIRVTLVNLLRQGLETSYGKLP